MVTVELVQGDITRERVDAIVNAANSSLLGGGGVDGAIHRAGGPEILAACEQLRRSHYGRGLREGDAVATTAGRLEATWVIHTVGPVWSPYGAEPEVLRSCYQRSLEVAAGLGARSVAFPLVSAGIFGWPEDDAARIALEVLAAGVPEVPLRRLVLFGEETYATAARVWAGITSGRK
ncbi:macro domain-containing protein [Actinorhabdospora filicis]|uniref:Macro domain-containing protein n=1 Tax=Actinorhabdospora filicis TaxID=1785913 RepID=A0A9W6SMK0_9ACTN|nr:O-acetyl-ADP-ribose deacetylase [Actinorhabdospora filicis]GLZ78733.1 macro domain-containing protein [Actinorhabdospora filicis]